MDSTLEQIKNIFENNFVKIKEEYNLLIKQMKITEEKNIYLEQENIKLKNTISELNREKKEKSSSAIWESMNSKLGEKDVIIEQLKKDIEFYKRTGTKTNVGEKYQYNLLKQNSSIFTEPIYTTQNNSIIIENNIQNKIINDNKQIEIVKNEQIEIVKNEQIEIVKNEQIEIVMENQVASTKKLKDKSKDKSEKKKKKKIIEEENDLDDLEKELADLK